MPKKESFFNKLIALLPLISSLLMLVTIAFTYYTYFYDVQKVPQLIVQIKLEKIEETANHIITKIIINVKNQSKSRVDIVANQGKFFGYNCNLINPDSIGTDPFIKKIQDTVNGYVQKNYHGREIEIHKNIDCINENLIGFFQPFHNDIWLLPEEMFNDEIITAVPKVYDLVRFYYSINYSLKQKNITSNYVIDSSGNINYRMFFFDEKDSLKTHELDYTSEEDREILLKYEIIYTGTKSELWLRSKNPLATD